MIGACLNPVNTSMIAIALVPIGHGFGTGPVGAAVLVAALYAACIAAQPVMGRLAQRHGPRRVFLAGTALVAVGGVVGATAPALWVLVVARVLLGVGSSAAYPTAMMLIRRRADGSGADPGPALGALTIAAQATAALGLPLGGLLVALGGWRATLWVNVPVAATCLAMAWRWVPRDRSAEGDTRTDRLDLTGMALFSATTTAAVTLVLPTALPVAVGAVLLGAVFVWWELRRDDPFIDVRRFAADVGLRRTYLRNTAAMLLTYSMLFGYTQWLQDGRRLTAVEASLVMLPMMVTSVAVTAPVARRRLVRAPLVVAAVVALGVAGWLRVGGATTSTAMIVAQTAAFGIVVGLASVGNQAALFGQAPAGDLGVAAGLLRTSGYVGGMLSSGVTALVFGAVVTVDGLHRLAEVMAVVAAGLVLATWFDRTVPHALTRGPAG
ncbi:MAG: hypothetical protein ABS81_09585 [Pseudonocardia sp. SCN 72-86]|nr:MAG: hypothetical protein ABS81_09585 [Pseudonocardia sp. SCN 72-86]